LEVWRPKGAGVWVGRDIHALRTYLDLVKRSVLILVEIGPEVHEGLKDFGRSVVT